MSLTSMGDPTRVLVVGGRGVGAVHVQALRQVPGVVVDAVAGATADSARAAASRFGIRRWSGDYRELVGAETIDAVHVCTPNDAHLPVVRDALAAGKQVVCEKPVATTVADAEEMVRLAAGAGGAAYLCYQYRCLPLVQRLRALVTGGALGSVHAVRGQYLQGWRLAAGGNGWRDDPSRAGAFPVLFDIGTHLIDLVEHVTGELATDPCARPATPPAPGGPGRFQAGVLFQAGAALGSILVSQVSAGSDNHLALQVDGAQATATWTYDGRERLTVDRRDTGAVLRADVAASARHVATSGWEYAEDPTAGFVALFGAVYGRAPGSPDGHPPPPRLADGLRHVRFLERCGHTRQSPAPAEPAP